MRGQLASQDLSIQLAARRVLTQAGPASFKFIADSLETDASKGIDRTVLVHNLSQAILEFEQKGSRVPSGLYLKLALSNYDVGNYEMSGRAFERAGDKEMDRRSALYVKRGFAFQRTGSNDKAGADFKTAVTTANGNEEAVIARNALGMWLLGAGQYDEAATQYKEALKLAPTSWLLYNNLAFANAERGNDLPEAISLINEALRHRPKDPNYLDTKGWILFKQGKNTEATSVLEQARVLAPNDKEIAKHLDEVKRSASQSKR